MSWNIGVTVVLATLTAGCTTTNLEDIAPQAALPQTSPAPNDKPATEAGTERARLDAPARATTARAARDSAQVAATPPAPTVESPTPTDPADGLGKPRNTGEFPNINDEPVGETAQRTDLEQRALKENLADAKAKQAESRESTAAYTDKLKRLLEIRRSHVKDTVAEIEAGASTPDE